MQLNPQSNSDSEKVQFLDLLIVLAKHKKIVIGMPLASGVLALAVSLLITPVFTSTATILPPQQQSSGMAAMLGQIGGLAGAASGLAGIKSPDDLYVGFLESRTIADRLIDRFKLSERYGAKNMDEARKSLASNTLIASGKKDGLISVAANDKDAQFAAELANGYVEELARLTQTIALTESSQRRMFFEKQLKDAKNQLAEAEVALKLTQEKTGMVQPSGQVQTIFNNVAQVRAAIAAKEIQLKSLRTFATEKNPEFLRLQEELRAEQAQLAKLEKNQSSGNGDFMLPTGNIPAAGVAYVRSVREVKYYETIFELLAKQFELAKIDEAKESTVIQLLDKAVPAAHKSKPNRALITLIGVLIGAAFGIILAFLRAAYTDSQNNPEKSKLWQKLGAEWRQEPRTE